MTKLIKMKNILLFIIFFPLSLFSQLDSSRYYVSLGYGFVPSQTQTFDLFDSGNKRSLSPIIASFEMPLNYYIQNKIADQISFGVMLGFSFDKSNVDVEKYSVYYYSVLFRSKYHLKSKKGFTPYLGCHLGKSLIRTNIDTEIIDVLSTSVNLPASGVFFGVLKDFNESFQGFIEVGTSISLISGGITIKI